MWTKIKSILSTIYFWSLATIATIVTATVSSICYPFVSQKTFGRIFESVAGYIIIYGMSLTNIWSFKITDKRKEKVPLDHNTRYILIANHLSFVDSLIVVMLPFRKKFMMAKLFAGIPVFGHLCKASGHILVDKHDKTTTEPAVNLAIEAMQDGSSFMIYPEGQRGRNPKTLLPFKTGAFRLSQQTGLPILPLAIKGTDKALHIGGIAEPADIEIIIGDLIHVGPEWSDVNNAIEKSRNFILDNL